jgi:hypothetical protein
LPRLPRWSLSTAIGGSAAQLLASPDPALPAKEPDDIHLLLRLV